MEFMWGGVLLCGSSRLSSKEQLRQAVSRSLLGHLWCYQSLSERGQAYEGERFHILP